jgi:hypothetical protein
MPRPPDLRDSRMTTGPSACRRSQTVREKREIGYEACSRVFWIRARTWRSSASNTCAG